MMRRHAIIIIIPMYVGYLHLLVERKGKEALGRGEDGVKEGLPVQPCVGDVEEPEVCQSTTERLDE
jgi:hypothetical protein